MTNNPLVEEKFGGLYEVCLHRTDFTGLLTEARDMVHRGALLLTHPLSGSVKPKETPYKSILLETGAHAVDLRSLEMIESAIAACGKFGDKAGLYAKFRPEVLDDFALIDCELITSALKV